MKLHTEKRTVERGGVVQESEFTIKATAKAFGILSSGLYSDKPLAIVRELSCNAYDAHVAAGKKDEPFDIKLPTTLDLTFMVKDYGTGLSHEDVINLYSTYFESTKADSDDYIGALGLGSKSPFSYVSTFNVESRFKGMKRLYAAFINENGVPSISLLGEQKSDEPNGMTISFGVKRGDEEKFRTAAARALMYFKPCPNVKGGGANWKPIQMKHTVHGAGWRVRECHDWNTRGPYVVQGFVAYPIDRSTLEQADGWTDELEHVFGVNIDLYVPLGQVEIAASREALQYTKRTVDNLIAAARAATKEMRVSFQKEFDKCKTRWEVAQMYAHFRHGESSNLFNSLDYAESFKWNKKDISDEITLNMKGIKSTQLYAAELSSYRNNQKIITAQRWEPASTSEKHTLHVRDDVGVYVDDLYSNDILSQYLQNTKDIDRVYVLRGVSKKVYDQREVDSILNAMGVTKYEVASALPYKTTRTATGYRARKVNEVLVWTGFKRKAYGRGTNRNFSRLTWDRDTIDMNKVKGMYVELDRFKAVYKKKVVDMLDEVIRTADLLGLVKTQKVYGLNDKQVKVAKACGWTNFIETVASEFNKANKNDMITNRLLYETVSTSIGYNMNNIFITPWKDVRKKVADGEFKRVFDEIYDLKENCVKNQVETVRAAFQSIPDLDTTYDDVKKKAEKILAEFKQVMNQHKMIGLLNWNDVRGTTAIDTIIEYVNMLAEQ